MALTQNVKLPIKYSLINNYKVDICELDSSVIETIEKEFAIPNAYVRIEHVTGNKTKVRLDVNIYSADQSTLITNKEYFFIPDVEDPSDNFIKQGYEYLKSLTEYAQALDC